MVLQEALGDVVYAQLPDVDTELDEDGMSLFPNKRKA